MNAVERLWRALTAGDWASLRAQFSAHASIDRPGESTLPPDEYVAWHRAAGRPDAVALRRSTGDGTTVAVEAEVDRGGSRFRVVALYDLHDGRVAGGTEAWIRVAR